MSSANVVIVMGVSGAGKTTVGKLLACKLGWQFRDADDLHSVANREKMRHGIPSYRSDRRPWLGAVRELVDETIRDHGRIVIACSALKQSYREVLAADSSRVRFVYLKGSSSEAIASRLAGRSGHFMNKGSGKSQLSVRGAARGYHR